jgi:hypothetical protein
MKTQDGFKLGVQFLFSFIVLLFCLYKMLVSGDNQSNNAVYWGGITSILAWWMPSPGSKKEESLSMNANRVNIEKAETTVTAIGSDARNGSTDGMRSLNHSPTKN